MIGAGCELAHGRTTTHGNPVRPGSLHSGLSCARATATRAVTAHARAQIAHIRIKNDQI